MKDLSALGEVLAQFGPAWTWFIVSTAVFLWKLGPNAQGLAALLKEWRTYRGARQKEMARALEAAEKRRKIRKGSGQEAQDQ